MHRLAVHIRPRRRLVRLGAALGRMLHAACRPCSHISTARAAGAALGCMLLVALANIQSTRSVRSRASHVARRCIAAHSDTADSTATLACTFEGSMVHGARCTLHVAHCMRCTLHALHVARCTRCGTRLAATLSGLLLSSSAPTVGNSTYSILWPRGSEQHGSIACVPHTHEALAADEDAQRIEGQAAAPTTDGKLFEGSQC